RNTSTAQACRVARHCPSGVVAVESCESAPACSGRTFSGQKKPFFSLLQPPPPPPPPPWLKLTVVLALRDRCSVWSVTVTVELADVPALPATRLIEGECAPVDQV